MNTIHVCPPTETVPVPLNRHSFLFCGSGMGLVLHYICGHSSIVEENDILILSCHVALEGAHVQESYIMPQDTQ